MTEMLIANTPSIYGARSTRIGDCVGSTLFEGAGDLGLGDAVSTEHGEGHVLGLTHRWVVVAFATGCAVPLNYGEVRRSGGERLPVRRVDPWRIAP